MKKIILVLMVLSACDSGSDSINTSNATSNVAAKIVPILSISQISTNAIIAGNIVIDTKGNIYFPDCNHFVVTKIDTNGTATVFAGSNDGNVNGTGTQAQFSRPYMMTIDSQDNLYVADYGNYNIRKITPSGVVTTLVTIVSGNLMLGLTADLNGNLYYSETVASGWSASNIIKKITPAGVISILAGSGSAGNSDGNGTAASFNNPNNLVTDSSSNVYVVDVGNFSIRKITPTGTVTTLAGSGRQAYQDGVGTQASFFFYQGLNDMAIDSQGTLYVSDMDGSTGYMRMITQDGTVSTYCGNGSNSLNSGVCTDSGLWINSGLTIDSHGTIYFGFGNELFKISQ